MQLRFLQPSYAIFTNILYTFCPYYMPFFIHILCHLRRPSTPNVLCHIDIKYPMHSLPIPCTLYPPILCYFYSHSIPLYPIFTQIYMSFLLKPLSHHIPLSHGCYLLHAQTLKKGLSTVYRYTFRPVVPKLCLLVAPWLMVNPSRGPPALNK